MKFQGDWFGMLPFAKLNSNQKILLTFLITSANTRTKDYYISKRKLRLYLKQANGTIKYNLELLEELGLIKHEGKLKYDLMMWDWHFEDGKPTQPFLIEKIYRDEESRKDFVSNLKNIKNKINRAKNRIKLSNRRKKFDFYEEPSAEDLLKNLRKKDENEFTGDI